jgi:hypothetical protein
MHRLRSTVALVVTAVVLGGCGTSGGSPPSPVATSGSPSSAGSSAAATAATITATATASVWRLRYTLLSHYPNFAFCDPDLYPVARGDQQAAADAWWASVNRGSPEVLAILAQHTLREPLTAAQRLTVYSDHKRLTAIAMTQVALGYEYQLSISTSGGQPNQTVTGTILLDGSIRETSRRASPGGCPI